jgi:hypothetical protein
MVNYDSAGSTFGASTVASAGTVPLAFTGLNTVWLVLTAFTLMVLGLAVLRIAKGHTVRNRSAVK